MPIEEKVKEAFNKIEKQKNQIGELIKFWTVY